MKWIAVDYGDARTGHKLLHALAFCTGVVITITFQQINDTPHAETGTEGNNEGLEDLDGGVKKCHRFISPESRSAVCIGCGTDHLSASDAPFKICCFMKAVILSLASSSI